jgi:hypothetical protein
MISLNIGQISVNICAWASFCEEQRPGFFAAISSLQGGWESWVQADFAAYLNSSFRQFNGVADIQREMYIYATANNKALKKRVDWLFNLYAQDTGYYCEWKKIEKKMTYTLSTQNSGNIIAIELKCEHVPQGLTNLTLAKSPDTRNAFWQSVETDYKKMITNFIGSAFTNCQKYLIVFCIDSETYNYPLKVPHIKHPLVGISGLHGFIIITVKGEQPQPTQSLQQINQVITITEDGYLVINENGKDVIVIPDDDL